MRNSIIFIFNMITYIISTRLDIKSDECSIFLKKLGIANQRANQLNFTGNVEFANDLSYIQVSIRYFDDNYFDNESFYGLVQEDGHRADGTCLDLKLYQYNSINFTNEILVTDIAIQHTSNSLMKWRYYYFIIPKVDLENRLININNYTYNGYYSIKFYTVELNELKYSYYFSFIIPVNMMTTTGQVNTTISEDNTIFHPINQSERCRASSSRNCVVVMQAVLQWCSDFTCRSIISIPNLHYNDSFVLKLTITTPGLNEYYLSDATIAYIGNGQIKCAKIVQSDNSHQGYAIYLLNAEVTWSKVVIAVNAHTSTSYSKERQFTNCSSSGIKTEEIECIKFSKEQCSALGYQESQCEDCASLTSNYTNQTKSMTIQLTFTIMLNLLLIF